MQNFAYAADKAAKPFSNVMERGEEYGKAYYKSGTDIRSK